MLPPPISIGFLLATALLLGYLVGHKKGLRDGINLSKELSPEIPPLDKEPVIEPEAPAQRERFGLGTLNRLYNDGYSVTRGGVIFRGGLEIAIVGKEHGPFGFERLHDVREMTEDSSHCRALSRTYYETFGLDEGISLREGSYFVSDEGMFWKGSLLLYRLSDNHELEEWPVTSSSEFFKKPEFEDREACSQLLTRWKTEFLRSHLPVRT
jgi:hypothetical protein